MVDFEGGLKVLRGFVGGEVRVHREDNCVWTDVLCEEVDDYTMEALMAYGWTGIDDHIGYEIKYTPEFQEFFRTMVYRYYDSDGAPLEVKHLAWDTWQKARSA